MAMQLVIDVSDGGQVSVTGPIENKILCFGLLKVAEQVVAAHGQEQASPILRPRAIMPVGRG